MGGLRARFEGDRLALEGRNGNQTRVQNIVLDIEPRIRKNVHVILERLASSELGHFRFWKFALVLLLITAVEGLKVTNRLVHLSLCEWV